MKRIILLFSLLILASCGNSENNQSKDEWYAGGTLHKATLQTWKLSTEENKLATCADFVANTKEYDDLDQMKADATEVMNCIDEAAMGNDLEYQKTNEIAAGCVILLGINN
jgi:hypothetical protein